MALLQTKLITNASATPGTVALTTTTTGSLLFCAIVFSNTTATPVTSITTTGATWTKIASTAATGQTLERWYAFNITGATTPSVNIAFNDTSGNISAIIREYSGVSTTAPLDKSISPAASGSGTSLSSGATATTTQANELVIGSFSDVAGSGQVYTAGSGYANMQSIVNASTGDVALEDATVSATGAQTATATMSTLVSWMAAADTFKLAGGGGGPTAHNLTLLGVGG